MQETQSITRWGENLIDKPFFDEDHSRIELGEFVKRYFSTNVKGWILVKDGTSSIAFRSRALPISESSKFFHTKVNSPWSQEQPRYVCGYFPYRSVQWMQKKELLKQGAFWSLHEPLRLQSPEVKPSRFTCNIEFEEPDQHYLIKVENIQNDIRSGRYYQLNLLRWANVQYRHKTKDVSHKALKESLQLDMLAHWISGRDAKGCVFHLDSLGSQYQALVSFSPESFVEITGDQIFAMPIKGTAASEAELMNDYSKNSAELAMITDLMRNDLFPVCKPGTVSVREAAGMLRLDTLVHLQSTVSGSLKESVSYADLFGALLPVGSITGAPKPEVCKAIDELEQRSREAAMGVFFVADLWQRKLTSRVLIRSLQLDWSSGEGLYGVGSGVTLASDPEAECEEIQTKCRILKI